jgi:hypothetical protein
VGQREREASPQTLMTPIWSPEAIADLVALWAYIEEDNPDCLRGPKWDDQVGFRNTRTRDPEDAVHRAVPAGWQHDPDSARLPRRTSMAQDLLRNLHPFPLGVPAANSGSNGNRCKALHRFWRHR